MTQRLGAGSYMAWSSTLFVAWSLLALAMSHFAQQAGFSLTTLDRAFTALAVPLAGVFTWLSVKRLKDLDLPRWLIKLLAFPLLTLILMPYLLLVSSPQRDHPYGEAPPSSGLLKIAGSVLLLFVAINLSFAAAVFYLKARQALGG